MIRTKDKSWNFLISRSKLINQSKPQSPDPLFSGMNEFKCVSAVLRVMEYYSNIQLLFIFPQTKLPKSLANLLLFHWEIFSRTTFFRLIYSDLYIYKHYEIATGANHPHSFRIPLVNMKFHLNNFLSKNRYFVENTLVGKLPR